VKILTTALPDGLLSSPYAQTLTCAGGSAPCAWSVLGGRLPDGLALDPVTGLISGSPVTVETTAVTVEAFDPASPANSATAMLSMTIDPPPLAMSTPVPPAGRVGLPYALGLTATGAVGSLSWSISSGALPPGIALDAFAGVISGVPTMWGTFTATIQVHDSWALDRTDARSLSIVVAPLPLAITTAALTDAHEHQAYGALLGSIGGAGLTSWSVTAGALPAGLTLDASGNLSGTPTATGTYAFTVQAVDGGWPTNAATQTLTLTVASGDIVLYATDAATIAGAWSFVADTSAANGTRLANPDRSAPKLTTPLAAPGSYFDIGFQAQAGVPYHLWIRGKAEKDYWGNDSVYVQFSGSVDQSGAPLFRIGTTGATTLSIEEAVNAGLSGWGWADNCLGCAAAPIYFEQTGVQTIRVQVREDGVSIDQIVLGADRWLTAAPGMPKNDNTILTR